MVKDALLRDALHEAALALLFIQIVTLNTHAVAIFPY